MLFFNVFQVEWPRKAQERLAPGPRPSKKLESWKNIIKVGNCWKFLEILGKLKVFQHFSLKKLENHMIFNAFP